MGTSLGTPAPYGWACPDRSPVRGGDALLAGGGPHTGEAELECPQAGPAGPPAVLALGLEVLLAAVRAVERRRVRVAHGATCPARALSSARATQSANGSPSRRWAWNVRTSRST